MSSTLNRRFSRKEPGAWAHNVDYVAQLLYDGVSDLPGGDVEGLIRPEVIP